MQLQHDPALRMEQFPVVGDPATESLPPGISVCKEPVTARMQQGSGACQLAPGHQEVDIYTWPQDGILIEKVRKDHPLERHEGQACRTKYFMQGQQ